MSLRTIAKEAFQIEATNEEKVTQLFDIMHVDLIWIFVLFVHMYHTNCNLFVAWMER